MKNFLYIYAICSILATLFSCSGEHNSTDSIDDNPFRLDSVHFADFYHQSVLNKQIRSIDSTYWSFTDVTERLRDSIYYENGIVIFGVNRSLTNGNLSIEFFITATHIGKKDSITTYIGNQRFYQILSAMKFIRNKMNYYPEVPTDIYFMENDQLYIVATYEPSDSTWNASMLVRAKKGQGTQRIIRLSPEKFDSLINKMNAMRNYLMK